MLLILSGIWKNPFHDRPSRIRPPFRIAALPVLPPTMRPDPRREGLAEDYATAQGQVLHEKVHSSLGESRPGVRIETPASPTASARYTDSFSQAVIRFPGASSGTPREKSPCRATVGNHPESSRLPARNPAPVSRPRPPLLANSSPCPSSPTGNFSCWYVLLCCAWIYKGIIFCPLGQHKNTSIHSGGRTLLLRPRPFFPGIAIQYHVPLQEIK